MHFFWQGSIINVRIKQMNTRFWHKFLPVCRMDGIFPTDRMFVFCHTDYTDCTVFFSQSEWKEWKRTFSYVTRREHFLISHRKHGKHRISAARGFLSHGLHGFFFQSEWKEWKRIFSYVTRMAQILLSQSDFKILEKNFLFCTWMAQFLYLTQISQIVQFFLRRYTRDGGGTRIAQILS